LLLGGLKQLGVSSMGPNMVLLKAADPECVEEAERRNDPWWRGLFSSVKRWSPNRVALKRRVWLKVYGLPLHVWDEKCFKQLGALYGDFVDFDEDTINLNRLDLARICVNASNMAFINEKIRVEIMGAMFDVWIVEEVEQKVVSRRLEDSGWDEGSSVSSNGGRGGGVVPEFLEEGDEVSPRVLVAGQLDLIDTDPNCQHLLLRRQLGSSERIFDVGPQMGEQLEKQLSKEPMLVDHVEGGEKDCENQNLNVVKEVSHPANPSSNEV
jgi:hypothetical protein